MTEKEVKEETPEVKELTIKEIIEESKNYTDFSSAQRGGIWAKFRCDEYWKSVIEQKDQEHEKAKLELIEFAYSERNTIVSLQKEVEDLSSKLFRKDQEMSEQNKVIETYISLVDDAAKEILKLEERYDCVFNNYHMLGIENCGLKGMLNNKSQI